MRPEFWDHEGIGALPRDARLLFLASWNVTDDEGLVRWTATFLNSQAFRYDDLPNDYVEELMVAIVAGGHVVPYEAGATRQRLGWIPGFRDAQKPNRPQTSRLPPPPLSNPDVREAYGERDDWSCARCGGDIARNDLALSLIRRGSAHPKNVQILHTGCGGEDAGKDDVSSSLNDSRSHSLAEGRGEEGRVGEGSNRPSARCPQHVDNPKPPNCGACKEARLALQAWERDTANTLRACRLCNIDGYRLVPGRGHIIEPPIRCNHQPLWEVS
ncbi:hypothetical protein [Amycolatopsis thermoflava]|uniref:hypothetical protein n=1 Tax=Amycolatopsis thermoflava TaxID=84480 RepID=UPI000412801B|nr:hypothetical protein [Amycolatopsis thermoflava]